MKIDIGSKIMHATTGGSNEMNQSDNESQLQQKDQSVIKKFADSRRSRTEQSNQVVYKPIETSDFGALSQIQSPVVKANGEIKTTIKT